MPSKVIQCEFCNMPCRKDRYGKHVKSRHIPELAQQFLETSNDPHFNIIRSLRSGFAPCSMPVYSKRDEGACWYFGVVPRYFEEADSYASYVRHEPNMNAHKQFLMDVVKTIPLSDFLSVYQFPNQNAVPALENALHRAEEHLKNTEQIVKQLREKLETNGQLKVFKFDTLLQKQ